MGLGATAVACIIVFREYSDCLAINRRWASIVGRLIILAAEEVLSGQPEKIVGLLMLRTYQAAKAPAISSNCSIV